MKTSRRSHLAQLAGGAGAGALALAGCPSSKTRTRIARSTLGQVELRPASSRHIRKMGWLTARWSFAFAEYRDPANTRFGPLTVFNEDTIQPEGGFRWHPHRNMEIVTLVLHGTISHRDSTGGLGAIESGEVQRMRAGSGIYHEEFNRSKHTPLRVLQMWLQPRQRETKPGYEQQRMPIRRDAAVKLISGLGAPGALSIDQDAELSFARLERNTAIVHKSDLPLCHLFVASGEVQMGRHRLRAGDAARLRGAKAIAMTARAPAEVAIWDLPDRPA